jgi:hypothetical protein
MAHERSGVGARMHTCPSYLLFLFLFLGRLPMEVVDRGAAAGPVGRAGGVGFPTIARGEWFLKGPVPWFWLSQAAVLPGRALHVGIALWLLAGMRKSATVSLSRRVLNDLGVSRHSGYRALKLLEGARLVAVSRRRGRLSRVTLLPAPARVDSAAALEPGVVHE